MKSARISRRGKILWKRCLVATSGAERLKGIMLKSRLAEPLLIQFEREARRANSIHSLFCLVSFDAVFLDSKGKVVDVRQSIRPFTLLVTPTRECRYVLETPEGESRRVKNGDRLSFEG